MEKKILALAIITIIALIALAGCAKPATPANTGTNNSGTTPAGTNNGTINPGTNAGTSGTPNTGNISQETLNKLKNDIQGIKIEDLGGLSNN